MMIFEPPHSNRSEAWKRRYAVFEIVHTLIDFGAALCFIIGSIMFFSEEWLTPGTWLFLVGSILFACKPTVRLSESYNWQPTATLTRWPSARAAHRTLRTKI